ncbi:arsenate reductase [Bradyrhizobium sp. LB11.1]|jgi:arsenate reductase
MMVDQIDQRTPGDLSATTSPSRAARQLIAGMEISLRQTVREKAAPYAELGLDNPALTDDHVLDAMMAHPILINRPIVVTPKRVRLCPPSELALDLLPSQPCRAG